MVAPVPSSMLSGNAQANSGTANLVSAAPPSATQKCPYQKKLELGCFFDGTDNNKYNPEYQTDGYTNIPRLYDIYSNQPDDSPKDGPPVLRDKKYLAGVGGGAAPAPTK